MSDVDVPSEESLRWLADWLTAKTDSLSADSAYMLQKLAKELRTMAADGAPKTKRSG